MVEKYYNENGKLGVLISDGFMKENMFGCRVKVIHVNKNAYKMQGFK